MLTESLALWGLYFSDLCVISLTEEISRRSPMKLIHKLGKWTGWLSIVTLIHFLWTFESLTFLIHILLICEVEMKNLFSGLYLLIFWSLCPIDTYFASNTSLLEKEMATHSSVLSWRIPGTEVPGGLPSMGSNRVGRDWRDLAAAAAATLHYIYLFTFFSSPLPKYHLLEEKYQLCNCNI